VVVTDNNGTADSGDDFHPVYVDGDDGDGRLEPGEMWLFQASQAARLNQQRHEARATALEDRTPVEAMDPTHYFGVGIDVQAAVNAENPEDPTDDEDADDPPGLRFPEGTEMTLTYCVRARHTDARVALEVVITDDNGTPRDPRDDFRPELLTGDDDGDGLLDHDETWIYRFTATPTAGSHRHQASVSVVPVRTADGTRGALAITDRDFCFYQCLNTPALPPNDLPARTNSESASLPVPPPAAPAASDVPDVLVPRQPSRGAAAGGSSLVRRKKEPPVRLRLGRPARSKPMFSRK
jgi:hypothetical protein